MSITKTVAVLLVAATSTVEASPMQYWKRAQDAVLSHRDAIHAMRIQKVAGDKDPEQWGEFQASEFDHTAWNRPDQGLNAIVPPLTADTNVAEWCGVEANGQHQWFTENKCSKASTDMTYVDTHNNIREAKKGEVINMACDGVLCPAPKAPDCYVTPGICASDEWCMLNQQEVWDAAGAGGGNSIVQLDFCKDFFNSSEWSTNSAEDYHKMLQTNVDKNMTHVELETAIKLFNSAADRCSGTDGMAYGVAVTDEVDYMKGARGRCVKYRQEGQSCVPQFADFIDSSKKSLLPKMESGKQFKRPLLCDTTRGLQCTGSDFDVMPSTCVAERPKDVCFLGPWWDSTVCPRSETKAKGGLDYETTLNTVRSFLLLFPGDVGAASDCSYWDKSIKLGQATYDARVDGYAIVSALWPAHLGGKFASPGLPSFEQFEKGFVLPGISRKVCDAGSKDKDSRIAFLLAVQHIRTERANNIWSFIHFMMHNQPDFMNARRIAASREMANHLSQRYWCSNCRSYFTDGILEPYGLPPNSNNPIDHAKYWNFGHNVASEHVATTRGDDPWIYQLGDESVADMQNLFYVSFEQAEQQWKYDATEKEEAAVAAATRTSAGGKLRGSTKNMQM